MRKNVCVIIAIAIIMMANSVGADNLVLTTHGKVLTPITVNRNYPEITGSVLVDIQGMYYAVEDTPLRALRKMGVKIGDQVLLGFELNEKDILSKIYILRKL